MEQIHVMGLCLEMVVTISTLYPLARKSQVVEAAGPISKTISWMYVYQFILFNQQKSYQYSTTPNFR